MRGGPMNIRKDSEGEEWREKYIMLNCGDLWLKGKINSTSPEHTVSCFRFKITPRFRFKISPEMMM